MTKPSWKQLARIPESLLKRAVLNALAIEPPHEGISDVLDLPSGARLHHAEAGLILTENSASFYITPKDAHSILRLKKSTPTGELLTWWLIAKGYINSTAPQS